MTVLVVYIAFLSLLGILFVTGTYFVTSLISRNLHGRHLAKRLGEIRELFDIDMKSPDDLLDVSIDVMQDLVLNRLGLEAFTQCYEEYTAQHGYTDEVRDYAARIVDYKALLRRRIVRRHYRESFILHLLAEFRVNQEETNRMVLDCLHHKSLYVRNNALRVIKNTGETRLMMEAIDFISKGERYFNEKMLIDFLDTFLGNSQELVEALLEKFDSYNLQVKHLILGYLMNQKADAPPVHQLMLRCMGEEDKELVIAATKYFGWLIDEEAGKVILRNLDHVEWEIRALSARVSQRGYESPAMIDALERRISDRNWFVRQNSAYAFMAMVHDEDRIQRIIDGEDKYAREITLYVMFVKNMIDYEEYLRLTRLDQEAEAEPVMV
jgi:hypothetical protein